MNRFAAFGLLSAFATPALAAPPQVVTDTPVVHSLTAQVMGGLGSPAVLLEPGADPHSLQLRPSQARALSEAGLVFWVGEGLTPSLARSFETLAENARIVELIEAEGLNLIAFDEEHHEDHAHSEVDSHDHDHDHDHADEHAHDDDHDHDQADEHAHDDDHDHGPVDVHAWLDPANAVIWVDAIAAALSEADPENAGTYAANATATKARIDAMTSEVSATLAPVEGKPIVVFHDAYDYFARSFGVTIAGSVALGDAAAPGVQRIRELEATLAGGNVACVFREPQHDPSIAERVAEDAGIGLGTLDPGGSSLAYGPDLYFDLMTGLAQSIAECVDAAS